MSEAGMTKEEQLRQDGWAARCLLRECRAAALATAALGQPFASLVTPATTPTCDIILLLSNLSEHTRHLRAEPRCTLFVAGEPATPNPQTAPRVSITGTAEMIAGDTASLLDRYLAVHPYARPYSGFHDFKLWRFTPISALMVGGFARATRLRPADLVPNQATASRIEEEAEPLLAAPPQWIDRVTERAGLGAGWRLTGIDLDGIDLTLTDASEDEHSVRISFPQPVAPGQSLSNCLSDWIK